MDLLKSYWPFKRPAEHILAPADEQAHNYIRVADLPIYDDDSKRLTKREYVFVEDPPLPLQQSVHDIRDAVYSAQQHARNTSDTFNRVYEYLQKDGSVMAKAGAITLGGMTGLLYGLRTGSCAGKRAHSLLGGTMRRVVMTGAGLGTMTAFCYPHETVRGVRHTWRTGREHFSQFVAPKWEQTPTTSDHQPTTPDATSKNIDLYTTRSKKID